MKILTNKQYEELKDKIIIIKGENIILKKERESFNNEIIQLKNRLNKINTLTACYLYYHPVRPLLNKKDIELLKEWSDYAEDY